MSTIGVKKLQYPDGGVASITLDSSGSITFGGQLSGTITADTITAGKFSTINTKTT